MKHSVHLARRTAVAASVVAAASFLAGCGKKEAASGAPPPAEVTVFTVTPEAMPIYSELPGRLEAVRMAEVRARVGGILLHKKFKEGSDVKEGDVLFQIDPAPLEAAAASARASVARAEATLRQAVVQEERYKKLLSSKAISRQEYDNAEAAALVAKADLLAAKAARDTAELNLSYATVTAPISGFIGRAAVTEGALVGEGETTKLAVIQELDVINFDFTQSSTDWLRLQQALREGTIGSAGADAAASVELMLEDGSVYAHKGRLLFSDVTVDPSTGNVTLRAEFPNKERLLLPGMFGRVRIVQAINDKALSVPQRAMMRGAAGTSTVLLVKEDNTVEARSVAAGRAVGDRWIITSGIAAGDRIVVEGLQKVRPGDVVSPRPFGGEPASATAGGDKPNAAQKVAAIQKEEPQAQGK